MNLEASLSEVLATLVLDQS